MDWQPLANVTDDDIKRRFAALIFKRADHPAEHMAAAQQIFSRRDQTALALQVATEWPRDPVVIAELERLSENVTGDDLTSKADLARKIMQIGDNPQHSPDERLKAYKQYAELMGFIQKPETGSTNNTFIDNRRVMMVPANQSAEEWERDAVDHQISMIEHAEQD